MFVLTHGQIKDFLVGSQKNAGENLWMYTVFTSSRILCWSSSHKLNSFLFFSQNKYIIILYTHKRI